MSYKKKPIEDDAPALADDRDGSVADSAASDRGGSGPAISKRTLLKGAATAPFAAAGLKYSTGRSRAIAPAVLIGAGVATGLTARWMLDSYSAMQSTGVSDGLSNSALEEQIIQTATTRRSTNASTIVDNQNILDGLSDTVYIEGKMAAIEALNAQKTQSAVETAAVDAAEAHISTIQANLIKTNNEAIKELEGLAKAQQSAGLGGGTVSTTPLVGYDDSNGSIVALTRDDGTMTTATDTKTLADGSTQDILSYNVQRNGSGNTKYNPIDGQMGTYRDLQHVWIKGPNQEYLARDKWQPVWNQINTIETNVTNGLITYVSNIYGQVQSGSIDTSDLLTPRERANMMADGETENQAIADLIALNQHVDADRTATITLNTDDITLEGTFARTANPSGETLEAGNTYDPSSLTGDIFFTYSSKSGFGTWTDYETNVDGGIVTFTAQPYSDVEYQVKTTAGETATVLGSAFAENSGVWETDISAQVDNAITQVDSVTFNDPSDSSAKYETIQLQQSFTIKEIVNSNDETVTSMSFKQSAEPQTDNNYITQSEFDEMNQRTQELIEKNQASSGGGGGLSLDQFSIGSIPGAGVLAVIAGGALWLVESDD